MYNNLRFSKLIRKILKKKFGTQTTSILKSKLIQMMELFLIKNSIFICNGLFSFFVYKQMLQRCKLQATCKSFSESSPIVSSHIGCKTKVCHLHSPVLLTFEDQIEGLLPFFVWIKLLYDEIYLSPLPTRHCQI